MPNRPSVRIAPTLDTMSALYRLSREGGPRSERFRAYVGRVEHEWGLVAYNPMAGDAARHAVDLLVDIGAESLAAEAAAAAMQACKYAEEITLAVVVRSRGMWTDRVATEIELRASPTVGYPHHGVVTLWAGEPVDAFIVQQEAIAETARVMAAGVHGPARLLRDVLWREGFAYALAERISSGEHSRAPAEDVELSVKAAGESRHGQVTRSDKEAIEVAFEILGDSSRLHDIAGVLFGDPACDTMGWPRLGIPSNAGYRWAVERARRALASHGPECVLRHADLQPPALAAAS